MGYYDPPPTSLALSIVVAQQRKEFIASCMGYYAVAKTPAAAVANVIALLRKSFKDAGFIATFSYTVS